MSRYYCSKCEKKHNRTSKKGKTHLEYEVPDDIVCPNCGFEMNSNIVICWRCGECVNEHINDIIDKNKPKTTNLQDAILRALTSLRRARTSTIAKKMQVNTNVIIAPLVNLRKKGLVKSKDGNTEKVWTKC